MGTYGKDYYENIEWLKKYAECEKVGNQLFLGVKGVGKSYLFKSYFTDEKIKELAERYKNIFVVTALNNRNKDSDIYSFIFDQVLRGIISVVDSETMVSLKNELEIIKTFFETDDTKLRQFLSVIKNNCTSFANVFFQNNTNNNSPITFILFWPIIVIGLITVYIIDTIIISHFDNDHIRTDY